jgi:hypothetical protein
MSASYLASLSTQTFEGIPGKVVPRTIRLQDPTLTSLRALDFVVSGYYDKLIARNERLQEWCRTSGKRLEEPECWDCLTHGQRLLVSLCALDGQVKNGGITQFFWNCPDLVFAVRDALATLGETELLDGYERALATLQKNQGDWAELRKQSSPASGGFRWEAFQESYALLNLDWFDTVYLNGNGQDEQGNSCVQHPGLGSSLLRRLVEYVQTHKEEFIK